jgi:hypothetical protein
MFYLQPRSTEAFDGVFVFRLYADSHKLQCCYNEIFSVLCYLHSCINSGFGGLEVACWLAFGTQVRGFAPGRSLWISRAKKILSMPSFGGEVKPSVPWRSFTSCKRSLNVTWKSAFRQNSRTFLDHSSTFRRWVLTRGDAWWRKLERLTKIAQ